MKDLANSIWDDMRDLRLRRLADLYGDVLGESEIQELNDEILKLEHANAFPDKEPKLLTYQEAAAKYHVHHKTLRNWVRAGKLTRYSVNGRNCRVDENELLQLWARNDQEAGE